MTRKNNIIKTTSYRPSTFGLWMIILSLLVVTACKKEVMDIKPGDTESAGLNIMSISDVMDAAYSGSRSAVAAHVDEYVTTTVALSGFSNPPFPILQFGYGPRNQAYPSQQDVFNPIRYVFYNAGGHRFYFTDVNNTVVLDTEFTLTGNSHHCVYLTDAPATNGTEARYQAVLAEETQQVQDGMTGIRFIHLSPDAGALTPWLRKADGVTATSGFKQLNFTDVSDYAYFDREQAVNGLLRFSVQSGTGDVSLSAGVTFAEGKNYVILIAGFQEQQQREIAIGKNANGSIIMESITIPQNLRTEVRISN